MITNEIFSWYPDSVSYPFSFLIRQIELPCVTNIFRFVLKSLMMAVSFLKKRCRPMFCTSLRVLFLSYIMFDFVSDNTEHARFPSCIFASVANQIMALVRGLVRVGFRENLFNRKCFYAFSAKVGK